MPNLQEYMTIKEAAKFLGVTPNTLRNWGAAGKITEHRHPINNYRLYKEAELAALLQQIDDVARRISRPSTKPRPK